jgi:replication factor A1
MSGGQATRYRLQLSDGQNQLVGMLSAQLITMVTNNEIVDNTIVEIIDYVKNEVSGNTVVVLLNIKVIGLADGPPGGGANIPVVPQQAHTSAALPRPPQQAYTPSPYAAAQSPYASANPYGGTANSRPVVRDPTGSSAGYLPISALNPYANKWTIKARITSKSELRRWANAKGEGTLFSVDLLDSQGSEIRGTFFKETADKFFPLLEEQKVYSFCGGKIKVANKQYSAIKNNYEITFDNQSDIHLCPDGDEIKTVQFNFVKIASLLSIEPNSMIDLCGVVKSYGEVQEINSTKLGKMIQKRDLTLIDDSETEVRLTLWGDKATNTEFKWHESPVVGFKNVKVGDYQGRTVGTVQSTTISINPPEGREIYEWHQKYFSQGLSLPSNSISGASSTGIRGMEPLEMRKLASSIRDQGLGMGEKPDYFCLKATVSFLKREPDPWYTACTGPECNKKVVETMNGRWMCEKCNQEYSECRRRYMLSVVLQDTSGTTWFSAFDDIATRIIGKTADELYMMKANGDSAGFEAAFNSALFKTYLVKARCKNETYGDESRVKSQILQLSALDYVDESKQLLDAISKYQ